MVEQSAKIRTFEPADIEEIVHIHQDIYEAEYGFNRELFGEYVGKYARLFHISYKPNQENIWIVECNGQPIGSIALVRVDDATAQLRWFVLKAEARGMKLGHRLMQTLLDFARQKQYQRIFLWTLDNLHAARHLYSQYGFTLTETQHSDLWGTQVTEERWDLELK